MDENKTKEHKERMKALRKRLPWHYTPFVIALYPDLKISHIRNVMNAGVTQRSDIIEALEEVAKKFGNGKVKTKQRSKC
jgi:hypothetical protein